FLLVVLGFWAGRLKILDDPAAHRSFLVRVAVIGITVSLAGALPSALIAVGALSTPALNAGLLMGTQVLTGVLGGAGYAAAFTLWAIRLERTRGPLTNAVAAVGQ